MEGRKISNGEYGSTINGCFLFCVLVRERMLGDMPAGHEKGGQK